MASLGSGEGARAAGRPRSRSLIIGLAIVALAALALGAHALRNAASPLAVTHSASRPMTFASIFDRVAPAVVSIEVRADRGLPLFGLLAPGEQGADQDGQGTGAGSGFFISPDGLILTNAHVIQGAREIAVTLHDGRRLPAQVVGRDETIDLAVLRAVDPRNRASRFPFVDLRDGGKPRVGDWVLAVGNPFGLGGTATAGIVSAYGRDINPSGLVDYMQLDAAINRGDFGGPAFDVYGRLVGVNTAILSPGGGSIGISFAIPADVAADTAKALAAGKDVRRGFIGATVQTLTSALAVAHSARGRTGALVAGVAPGAPAARAGLRPGDVVIAAGGEPIETGSALTRRIARAGPNQTVKLEVLRDGRTLSLTVRTAERPSPRRMGGIF